VGVIGDPIGYSGLELARVGPTTPTRARRLADASVDPTEARDDILGCVGRSDRSAQKGWPRGIKASAGASACCASKAAVRMCS
jgi:hypothetical protein